MRTALPDRAIHLVLENENNEASWLERGPGGEPTLYSAQWNDDVHHVLHVAATADGEGYYDDYLGRTRLLGRALAEGFAFQGEPMPYRGAPRGEPSGQLPPSAFVAFLQNHDQIGNRALGERITALASQPAIRALTAIYLLSPQIPMLFMGEEWQCPQPFLFFCDFDGELGVKVSQGRRARSLRASRRSAMNPRASRYRTRRPSRHSAPASSIGPALHTRTRQPPWCGTGNCWRCVAGISRPCCRS